MRKKRIVITAALKKILLKERRHNPYLGVRGLSKLLKNQYQVEISKSAVYALLKRQLHGTAKGRKKESQIFQRQALENCPLFLLSAMDSVIGFINVIVQGLLFYFPHMKQDSIGKIVTLFVFSSFAQKNNLSFGNKRTLLKITQLKAYPHRKMHDFVHIVKNDKPVISLAAVRKNVEYVSTVKISFDNGWVSYCDGRFATFWGGVCTMNHFFSPFGAVKARLADMMHNNLLMINYTKSFQYLSPLVFEFINGVKSGIKKIELLGEKGNVLDTITPWSGFLKNVSGEQFKPFFLIGYYPKILSKGMAFLEKSTKFKKLEWDDSFFYSNLKTRFFQDKIHKEVITNNVLIARKKNILPCWGIITDMSDDLENCLKKYLTIWPYLDKVFFEEIEIAEKFFSSSEKTMELVNLFPMEMAFNDEDDFAKVGEILSNVFRATIGDMANYDKNGYIDTGKHFIKIRIANVSADIKKKFNNTCFYWDKKRVFLA